jgi:hypothetical protein
MMVERQNLDNFCAASVHQTCENLRMVVEVANVYAILKIVIDVCVF